MDFELGFAGQGGAGGIPRRQDGAPFRLLLVGDFSGRDGAGAGQPRAPLRRPLAIDSGDVDLALERLEVSLPVQVPGAGAETVRFASLEDFHPDALFGRLAAFEVPRQLRAALAAPSPSPETFTAVEAWLQGLTGTPTASAPAAALPVVDASATPGESTESALERLLGRAPAPASSQNAGPRGGAAGVVNEFLAGIVRPHVTADVSARRAPLLAALDEALTRQMRAVLSAAPFRALEAAWRGVDRLARAVDTDADLQVALLDAGAVELAAALPAPGHTLEGSALHNLLVADEPRGWSLIAVEASFGRTRAELSVLAALAAVAARAGAALVADARPELAGAATLDVLAKGPIAAPAPASSDVDGAFWQALRESPLAARIALALPRVLARLPYGKKTDPISSFPFEELPPGAAGQPLHRVWGSAAFALAEGCAGAFRGDGWQMDPGAAFEIDGLPAHTYDDDGESRLVPATEVALGERALSALRPHGLTLFLARADRPSARCPGLSSIAAVPTVLAGPWSDPTS